MLSAVRLSREERLRLLAAADPGELAECADACLAATADVAVIAPPRVGCVCAQVREPIMKERFILGDVLACTAEVEFNGTRGWAMRLGDDRAATLAMAILDAAAEADPAAAGRVGELCARVAGLLRRAETDEWAELAPTIVEFEELA